MTDALTIISRFDEAIDYEAMGDDALAAYRETRDCALLAILHDQKPTVFHARRLRTTEMRDVNAQPADSLRYELAFRKALVRVDHMRASDGSRSAWVRPSDKPLNDAQVDQFSNADVQEVGSYIVAWSNLGKGRPAAWPLPATSALALEALGSLRAAQKRASAANSRQSSAPAEEPAGRTPGSSPDGATPGAVTATE